MGQLASDQQGSGERGGGESRGKKKWRTSGIGRDRILENIEINEVKVGRN